MSQAGSIGTMGRERMVGGSPLSPRSAKAGRKRGTRSTRRTVNPHSRAGVRRPQFPGRVMDHLFVGLNVAKDHLDVHVHPTGETFVVTHDEAGLSQPGARLHALDLT